MNDASGNPQDSSGNAHHVTSVVGTPTYSQPSPFGGDATAKSITLPDTAYFSVPDHADFGMGSTCVTIEAWVKRGSVSQSTNVLSHQSGGYLMSIYDTDDLLHLVKSGTAEVFFSTATINDLNWHHTVVTYDNTTKVGALWIDGVREATSSTQSIADTGVALLLGADVVASGSKGNLTFAEVALYISASIITDARIQAHYNAAVSQPPVAWFTA